MLVLNDHLDLSMLMHEGEAIALFGFILVSSCVYHGVACHARVQKCRWVSYVHSVALSVLCHSVCCTFGAFLLHRPPWPTVRHLEQSGFLKLMHEGEATPKFWLLIVLNVGCVLDHAPRVMVHDAPAPVHRPYGLFCRAFDYLDFRKLMHERETLPVFGLPRVPTRAGRGCAHSST